MKYDLIMAGDNGAVAFLIFMFAVLCIHFMRNKKYYRNRIKRMVRKTKRKLHYIKKIFFYKNEIIQLLKILGK